MDRRLLVLAIGMFALGTDSYVVAGVLPEISRAFDVSIGAAGQMTTVYSVTFALLSPTIAAIAAPVRRRTMLLAGVAIFVLANLATALAPTFGIALATRALAGLGAAMFSPTATGSAAMLVPAERRGFALNLASGRLIDRIGSRKVILTMLTVLAIDSALMPWTSAQLWTAVPAIAIWGAAGLGLLVPQQYRLVSLAPSIAPVLLGLNTASSFFGISAAGSIGDQADRENGGRDCRWNEGCSRGEVSSPRVVMGAA